VTTLLTRIECVDLIPTIHTLLTLFGLSIIQRVEQEPPLDVDTM
jgi:hypothetical protein